MTLARTSFLSALILAALVAAGRPTRADLTGFDSYGNLVYTQTANNTAPSGTPQAFYASRLFTSDPADITSGTGQSGSVSGLSYVPVVGANYAVAQTDFITPSQLGTYLTPGDNLQFTVTGGNLAGLSGSSPTYGANLYSSVVPYLTGNTYNMLQGFDATQAASITFNGYTAAAGANESDIYFTITNSTTGTVAYATNFYDDPSQTLVNLAANTLSAGTTYNLEIDYSSRLNQTGTFDGGSYAFTAGYDTRTEISFTTAPAVVPEPSSLVLAGLGLASAGFLADRRRKARASA